MGRISIPLVAACVAMTAAGASAFLAPAATPSRCVVWSWVCCGAIEYVFLVSVSARYDKRDTMVGVKAVDGPMRASL